MAAAGRIANRKCQLLLAYAAAYALVKLLQQGPLREHEPLRVYLNGHTFGVEGYVHQDNEDTENYFSTGCRTTFREGVTTTRASSKGWECHRRDGALEMDRKTMSYLAKGVRELLGWMPGTRWDGLHSLAFAVALCSSQLSWSNGMTNDSSNSSGRSDRFEQMATLKAKVRVEELPAGLPYAHLDRIAWSPDGRYFAVIGVPDNHIKLIPDVHAVWVYESTSRQLIRTLEVKHSHGLNAAIAFTPDGRYLAAGTSIISFWSTETWQPVKDIVGPYSRGRVAGGIKSMAFSPDGRLIAVHYESVLWPEALHVGWSSEEVGAIAERRRTDKSITESDAIMVFDVATGERTSLIRADSHTHPELWELLTANLVFSSLGDYLLTSSFGKKTAPTKDDDPGRYFTFLTFRNPKNGQVLKEISDVHVMPITAVALSSDGKLVATGTNTLSKEAHRNPLAGGWVWTTIDNRDPIRLWDVATGKKVREFGPLRGAVKSLAISPNGRMLISCQTDLTAKETIWLWDMATGRLIDRIRTPQGASDFWGCTLSPDGRHIGMPIENKIYLVDLDY